MINATQQFFLILQKLNAQAPTELLTPADIHAGNKALDTINESTTSFIQLVNSINDKNPLSKENLKDLSAYLRKMSSNADVLYKIMVNVAKRHTAYEDAEVSKVSN